MLHSCHTAVAAITTESDAYALAVAPVSSSQHNPNAAGGVCDQVALLRAVQQQQTFMSQLLQQQTIMSQPPPPPQPQPQPQPQTVDRSQRTIVSYLTPPRPATAAAAVGMTDIAAALQNPAVIAAVAAALGRQ